MKNTSKHASTRTFICLGLKQVLQGGQSLNEVLSQLPSSLPANTKATIQAGLYGVLRHYPSLCMQVNKQLKRDFKTKDAELLYLLCFALYQLGFQGKPAHAVVHETVASVTDLGRPWARAVVNAVLRQCTAENDFAERIRLQSSDFDHPSWWITKLKKAWPQDWQAILTANNQHAPLTLRINTEQVTVDEYIAKCAQHHIIAKKHAIAEHAIELETPCPVYQLPGFTEGLFLVQDASAQMAATLLDLKPGLHILDACAAPGGKTSHILHLATNLQVTALELDSLRAKRITDNLQRLHQKATLIIGDARYPKVWWDGQLFDRILCDVPCSASGIIRRHPDIKYLRRENDLINLAETQLAILQALWPLLKPNGILVYTTCSILPEENDAIISTWLQQTENVTITNLPDHLGIKTAYGRQRLPGQENMDGFYYAKMIKQ